MMSHDYNAKIPFLLHIFAMYHSPVCLPLVFRLSLVCVVPESQFLSENTKIIKT